MTAFKLRAIEVESLILAVSVDHRLSVEPVVSMADLRNEPFVAYESRDGTPRQRSVSIHNRAATKVFGGRIVGDALYVDDVDLVECVR